MIINCCSSLMHKPEVSIITVNYNGIVDTRELLLSLQTHLKLSYQVIVVDNGSIQNEAALLQKEFSWITTVRSEENLGFSGGNNLAIPLATSDYLYFLNNDTYLEDDSILALLDVFKTDPLTAGVSPLILFSFPEDSIQFAGYTELTRITLRNKLIGFGEKNTGRYACLKRTPYLHGAAMLFKKSIVAKVGFMPTQFFLYYEELDWSTQFTNKGYHLYYVPQSKVYHKESQSIGRNSALQVFYLSRNRLLYAYRNRKGFIRISSLVYLFFIMFVKDSFIYLFTGKWNLLYSVWKGCFSFICLQNKCN